MCLDTQDNSFGSMPFKYFPFACTVPVLVFFAFLPEISAMVTSAVNITKPLKRIYPQIQFFFQNRRRCRRIYVFFNSFTKISQSAKKCTKSFWPCFQLFFFTPLTLSLLLRIESLPPEMLSAWHFLRYSRFNGEKG